MGGIDKKQQIVNQAFYFHLEGNISEATKYYQYFIDLGYEDKRIFSNYGTILKGQGKLKEAELLFRKAIELNPNYAIAHSNLGSILRDLGKLKEAEQSLRKAIELNPDFPDSHSNLGNTLRDLGKLKEAEQSLRKAIEINPNFAMAYSNLGNTLRDLGKLKEAEQSLLKAIEINPEFAIYHSNLGNVLSDLGKLKGAEITYKRAIGLDPNLADTHSNLGDILRDLGKLKEAEVSLLKAIEINPDYVMAYLSLSRLKYSTDRNNRWQDKLFSKEIINNKSNKDQYDIYFARANIRHNERNYKESSYYLILANRLKILSIPSNINILLNKSKYLLAESNKNFLIPKPQKQFPQSVFIVGMPRSGSTLIESIISLNNEVDDLGEVNYFEECFISWNRYKREVRLVDLYLKKIFNNKRELNITTNKFLYNYQYAGIISSEIPNAKIIHCYRNPLDNILSIYRAHFAHGNEYSSSLIDCAEVYLDQDRIMSEYKNRFREKIYDLNYDLLVSNPNQEIKSLIDWLGWKWEKSYLSPHLNPRTVSTASCVQVRNPINSKSIGGWKNYKEMLQPAIEILSKTDSYKNLTN